MTSSIPHFVVACTLSALSFGATAQSSDMTKERDTVRTEAKAAAKAGEIQAGEGTPQPKKKAVSVKSRAQVKAGERSVPAPKKAETTKTRAEVKAETREAKEEGKLLKPGEIASQPRT
jgi:hypothetical protein